MALFASAILCNAHAQTKEVWPSKPVRFVVPFTAGGSIDVLARLVGRHLETRLNQPIVVENRAGAGGTVGTDLVARAPADGYTLLFTAQGPLVLNPFLMKRLLEKKHYQVSVFTDASEALGVFCHDPAQFDLVISDYNMPGMSGLDFARAVKARSPRTPVAITSGHLHDSLRAEAPAAGVNELIYKPDTVEELFAAVDRLATAVVRTSPP